MDEVGGVLDLGQLLEVAVNLVVGPGAEYALDKQLAMVTLSLVTASKVYSSN